MSKKKKIAAIISVAIIFAMATHYVSNRVHSFYGNDIVSVSIGKHKLYAETVSSEERLKKGLGARRSLCSSCGMLFKFQQAGKHSFWMKDMRFPLDIIWILQGRVVHIEKNIQPDFAGILAPSEESDIVLEINAGAADELGIKLGDVIDL